MSLRSSVIVQTPKFALPASAEKKKPLIEVLDEDPPIAGLESKSSEMATSGLVAFMKGTKSNRKSAQSRLPPQLDTTVTAKHRFRFEATSAIGTSFGITGAMLSGAFGGICTVANTTITGWVSTAKITQVTIWPGLSSSSQFPEVLWSGIVGAISKDVSVSNAMPGGVTSPGAVVSRPPKGSLCEVWVNLPTLNTSALFMLGNIPAQSIIDVDVIFQLRNNLGGYNLGVSTTATLGNVYYTALDGPSANKLPPVNLPTTH